MTQLEIYQPGTGLIGMVDRRTDSWTAVVEQVAILATRIADTELVPAAIRGKPAAVAAVILYGREIGHPPMTALRTSYVVNGRVALAAETMRGLVLAAGHIIVYRESTSARCIAAGQRHGQETWHEVEWTIDLARRAGIAGGQSWQRYPRQMLKARATAELCRDAFPDIIGGFAALEELDEPARVETEPPAPPHKVRRAAPQPAEPEAESPRPDDASPSTPGEVPLPGEAGYDEIGELVPGNVTSPEGPEPEPRDTGTWAMTRPQAAAMGAAFHDLGLDDRGDALTLTGNIIGRSIDTRNDLTRADYRALMDALATIKASHDPQAMIRDLITADFPDITADDT
jgi:hypothetical protein